jgi:cation diffusion facilitator family transporter
MIDVDRTGATESGADGESLVTVLVALIANFLIAVAKTAAAVITGAASMLAEAAHSWADAGNEVFLLIANRRGAQPPDAAHPFGYGREVYVWSMFAAIGLFAVGAGVSITHGIQELINPEPASSFGVAYAVLAVAFILEGISFVQVWRQSRRSAARARLSIVEQVYRTSDPTMRAVFFEDAAALVGVVIASGGIALHEITGSAVPDAIGSILVGVLLGVIALTLIRRNRDFLVGEVVDPTVRDAALRSLLDHSHVDRVTQLHLEFMGAGKVLIIGAVDLTGDLPEGEVSLLLAAVEQDIRDDPSVVAVVLSLSEPSEPALTPTHR